MKNVKFGISSVALVVGGALIGAGMQETVQNHPDAYAANVFKSGKVWVGIASVLVGVFVLPVYIEEKTA